jgi:riboflavin biosynthesis pyrimidine reductase
MRSLFPDPGPTEPARLIAGLRLADLAPPHRPYTVVNFVASADGRASVDGGSTGLGDAGDRAVFHALRGCADALLVGTGTLRAERYGALVRDPDVVRLRRSLRLPAQPPLVTITRSGSVPRIPLLDDPGSTLIVYAGAEVDLEPAAHAATVEIVRRNPDGLAVAAVLADLRAARGVGLLLCEGGPAIFGELIAARVCDELFLTLAAKLAGGDEGAITSDLQLPEPLALTLRWALEQDGSLYLRYGLHG